MTKAHDDMTVMPGTGNVFPDLGLPDAEESLAKAQLASAISEIIEERQLTQAEAARVLGSTQPKVASTWSVI